MATIQTAIDNLKFFAEQTSYDNSILYDFHIPEMYGMDKEQFDAVVREIDPNFDIYLNVELKLAKFQTPKVTEDLLELIASALEDNPHLSSISDAIRKVL